MDSCNLYVKITCILEDRGRITSDLNVSPISCGGNNPQCDRIKGQGSMGGGWSSGPSSREWDACGVKV